MLYNFLFFLYYYLPLPIFHSPSTPPFLSSIHSLLPSHQLPSPSLFPFSHVHTPFVPSFSLFTCIYSLHSLSYPFHMHSLRLSKCLPFLPSFCTHSFHLRPDTWANTELFDVATASSPASPPIIWLIFHPFFACVL